ncbi:MAG: repeat-associated core domain protein [Chloroflexi bacterium]|nr:repeat-associated core domain protein [Chloroflexota bacterium]
MADSPKTDQQSDRPSSLPAAPSINLPKGGGALRGIGEKFAANPVTGTASFTIPIQTNPGRTNFGPLLNLSYDSGSGNGPYGFGWSLGLPGVTRKTDKGLPRYQDVNESDVFILSGAEDLVPALNLQGGIWVRDTLTRNLPDATTWQVDRYRPRIETAFARIERWTEQTSGEIFWRSISRDNISTLYGRTTNSRIVDPADPRRVFRWLICESKDPFGNAIYYEYKNEDSTGVNVNRVDELQRNPTLRATQRYLKFARYGNRTPVQPYEDLSLRTDWMFEVVWDYGEHDLNAPTPQQVNPWNIRQDPFSTYKPGFEVRTYRLCQRVLMFHHFPAEAQGANCLVRSTDFTYQPSPVATYLTAITQSGYIRAANNTYTRQNFPPLEFEYSQVQIDPTVRTLDPIGMENLPMGLGSAYRFVDLDGEGLSGILSEQAGAWFYKPNLYGGQFGALDIVASKPGGANLTGGRQQLLDLSGDGQLDLASFQGAQPGFYERTASASWENFKTFDSLPDIDWQDPNLKFLDLDGDGHSDVLISQAQVLTWYPSQGEGGFSAAQTVYQGSNEDKAPVLVFADGEQFIYLSDMSGDGLQDIVRIRPGEVCYWPNLGYGKFGARLTMGNAPRFDRPDLFEPSRVKLADTDGSGTVDIIYLGPQGAQIFFNQSGNQWSDPVSLDSFPAFDDTTSVSAIDLMGNGTACLVWSSALLADARQPLQYIDLMGGVKPHLLVAMKNNLGAETHLAYTPSTRFYIEDKLAGKPWVTRLPFPVHTLERVETVDRISGTRLVTTYKYHHGYFDGFEREFRGFGKVERWDTESFEKYSGTGLFTDRPPVQGEEFHLPPVRTVSWYHTGAFLSQENISQYLLGEYYSGDLQAVRLPDTQLPGGLSDDERRDASRALKGRLLRQEIYAEDNAPQSDVPYSATEYAYQINLLQSQDSQRYASFYVYESESLTYTYERQVDDPRISHRYTLSVDPLGNPLQTAIVGYPRRPVLGRQPEQNHPYITITQNQYANQTGELDWYRAGAQVETCTYEMTGLAPAGVVFTIAELLTGLTTANEIPYEMKPAGNVLQKRRISHSRTLYKRDDLAGALSSGQIGALGLVYETYRLVLTSGLVGLVYSGKVTSPMLTNEAHYIHSQGDSDWWAPSGQQFLSPNLLDTPAQELAYASQHFFRPLRFRDPFGNTTRVVFDGYDLLLTETHDALGNQIAAVNHYRTLAPQKIIDPNDNQAAVRFDALGMVTATFVSGKAGEGDHFDDASVEASLSDDPTTHLEYDILAYFNDPMHQAPVFVHTFAREQHGASNPRWQETYTYSDGTGRVVETKIQAEAGQAPGRNPDGSLKLDGGGNLVWELAADRWVGTGRIIYDNKGNPFKQYEPFFDNRPDYNTETELIYWGVTPILRYDALSRHFRTDLPDGSYSKVVFDAWKQLNWDENDTVLDSAWYSQRGSPNPAGPEPGNQETRAAWLAAGHAGTPSTVHLDPLGRTFLTVADNGLDLANNPQLYETRLALDIQGNQLSLTDPLDRIAQEAVYDLLGQRVHQRNMESGDRWAFFNVHGGLLRRWDSRGFARRTLFDELQRPTHVYISFQGGAEALIERLVYGEIHPDVSRNLKSQLFQHYDQSGVLTQERFDFKGNRLESSQQLARQYRDTVDWTVLAGLNTVAAIQAAAAGLLEPADLYSDQAQYDAINRPLMLVTAHNLHTWPNVLQMIYNPSNLLETVDVWLRRSSAPSTLLNPATADLHLVTNIDYNARRQRIQVDFGSGVQTTYEYDPATFRLSQLRTQRPGSFPVNARTVQDLGYVYDAVGNPVHIQDDGDLQNVVFFNNVRVEPSHSYVYDPLYRLLKSSGREHLGLSGGVLNPPNQISADDGFRTDLAQPHNGQMMGTYTELYDYDPAGNLLKVSHQASSGSWTRYYAYQETSLIEPLRKSNRLSSTSLPGDPALGPYSAHYQYDAHGNLAQMPHLPAMVWDYADQLRATSRQAVNIGTPEMTYYVYDAQGKRVRKVTERAAGQGGTPTRKQERLYLDGLEIYREYDIDGTTVHLERESLPVTDQGVRLALIETKILDTQDATDLNIPLVRYQHGDHLGSVALELDAAGQVVSHEEYYPYGATSYQAINKALRSAAKRYRYTAKERDEESALDAFGQRYYISWLGRWASCDPAGMIDGSNLYIYSRNAPIKRVDSSGSDSTDFHYQLQPPSLLRPPQTFEQYWAERLAGTLVPPLTLSLTPSPGAQSPTPTTTPTNAGAGTGGQPVSGAPTGTGAPTTGGTTPTAPPTGGTGGAAAPATSGVPANASAEPSASGVKVSGGVIPPRLQIDYRAFRFSADTSDVRLRLGVGSGGSITAGYHYGGEISLSSAGPTGSGTVGVDPSSGVGSFTVRGNVDGGLRVSSSINTQGAFTYGLSGPGWNFSTGYAPAQNRFSLGFTYGPALPPYGSDVSAAVNRGYTALGNVAGGVPGVLNDLRTTPDFVSAHKDDFSAIGGAVSSVRAATTTPRPTANGTPQIGASLNISAAPVSVQNGQPTGGVLIQARVGVFF